MIIKECSIPDRIYTVVQLSFQVVPKLFSIFSDILFALFYFFGTQSRQFWKMIHRSYTSFHIYVDSNVTLLKEQQLIYSLLLNNNSSTLGKGRYEDPQVKGNPAQEIPEVRYHTACLPSVTFSTFVYPSCGHRNINKTLSGQVEQGLQPALKS